MGRRIILALEVSVHSYYEIVTQDNKDGEKIRVSSLNISDGWFEAISPEQGSSKRYYFKDYDIAPPPNFQVSWEKSSETGNFLMALD